MKKTIFFQKIIDSRFFAKWTDAKTKKKLMLEEIERQKKELEDKFNWITEYNKNSWVFTVWIEWENIESDEWSIQYRVNFFITPNEKTTYNTIYAIANSVWDASYFKFL